MKLQNLSRKSTRPPTIAIKNQKQTMSLTTMFTDDGMYNKVLLGVCQEVCLKMCYKYLLYKKLFYIYNCYVSGSIS